MTKHRSTTPPTHAPANRRPALRDLAATSHDQLLADLHRALPDTTGKRPAVAAFNSSI